MYQLCSHCITRHDRRYRERQAVESEGIPTVEHCSQLIEITMYPCELGWDLVEGVHDILNNEEVLRVGRR